MPKRKLLRAALALMLGLALIEGCLWILHFTVGQQRHVLDGGAAEILCLGDSHTYGWNVDAASTWPAKLGELSGVAITNRGAPGKNTATLLEELNEYLAIDQPRVVLILAGLNNPWSRPHAGGTEAFVGTASWSRTARLVKILASRFTTDEQASGITRIRADKTDAPTLGTFDETELDGERTEVRVVTREGDLESFVVGGGTLSMSEAQLAYDWITRDLVTLSDAVLAAGATPVLLTYALEEGEYIPSVNFTIREAAVLSETALIDVARDLAPLVDELTAERLFFPDAHPRREGYSAIASVIHDGLIRGGLIDGQLLGDPGVLLRKRAAPKPMLALVRDVADDGKLNLDLAFEPGLCFSVLLSHSKSAAEGDSWFGIPNPLARGELFSASERSEALMGEFDDMGRARLEVSAELAAELGATEGKVWASLVARTRDWVLLGASAPVRVR